MTSKARREFVIALAAAPLLPSVLASPNEEPDEPSTWTSKLLSQERIPFSFTIGGRKAQMQRISLRERHDTELLITDIELREAIEPLTAVLRIEEYPGSYCRLTVRMRAEKHIAHPIGDVAVLDLAVDDSAREANHLCGLTGGFMESHGLDAPAQALKPWTRAVRVGQSCVIDSDGSGRSSNSQVPLWVYAGAHSGYWFGPEWSGCWCLTVNRYMEGSRLRIGLPTLRVVMRDGEELAWPAAAFGSYRGDLEQGQNKLRATILKHFLPRHEGREPSPKVLFQGYAGLPKYQTEEVLYQEVDRAAEIGCEAFVLDAGWNHPPSTTAWPEWLGDWQPSAQRFPRGFDRFANYVHDKGMKLGLWIEPRAATSSPAYKRNPDLYLLPSSDSISSAAKLWAEQVGSAGPSKESLLHGSKWLNENKGLLDLSREEARTLLLAQLEDLLSLGADWIWFDFNTDPRLTVWNLYEKPDRQGMLELEFYQGLYAVFDTFLKRHPNVWIESCASGGRLIDLAMLRRSHSLWVCDTASDDYVNRALRGDANTLLPAATIQTGLFLNEEIVRGAPGKSVAFGGSHRFLTSFGGVLQFGQGLCFWNADDILQAKRHVQMYKKHRTYLAKDYFHLLPGRASRASWDAWQYHDPVEDAGIVLVFRPEGNIERNKGIAPRGLTRADKYRWSIVSGGAIVTTDSRELLVAMDAPGATLVRYTRQ